MLSRVLAMRHGGYTLSARRCWVALWVPLLVVLPSCASVAPDPNVRYIAFGDSSTAGPTDHDYIVGLEAILGEPADRFANQGLGGETSGEGLQRLRQTLSAGLFPNATTLLYWEGGNDVLDFVQRVDPFLTVSPDASNYPFSVSLKQVLDIAQGNIEDAVTAGQDAGLAVYVATYALRPEAFLTCGALPTRIMTPSQTPLANRYTELLNERIRKAAADTGATLVDIAPAVPADLANWYDCVHLSPQGNDLAAQAFAAAIAGG